MLWTHGALGKAACAQLPRALYLGWSHGAGGWAVTQGIWVIRVHGQKLDEPASARETWPGSRSCSSLCTGPLLPSVYLQVYFLGREFPKRYPGMGFCHGGRWYPLKNNKGFGQAKSFSWKSWLGIWTCSGRMSTLVSGKYSFLEYIV